MLTQLTAEHILLTMLVVTCSDFIETRETFQSLLVTADFIPEHITGQLFLKFLRDEYMWQIINLLIIFWFCLCFIHLIFFN